MNVSDLINALSDLPGDLEVRAEGCCGGWCANTINDVSVNDFGDEKIVCLEVY